MTWMQIGDLARHHQMTRSAGQLHRALDRHATELVQGKTQDPARMLRGDLAPLHAIESRLVILDSLRNTTRDMSQRLEIAQTSLQRIDTGLGQMHRALSTALLQTGPDALERTAAQAEAMLADAIQALSLRNAGQSVFGGATPGPPVAPASDILSALRTAVVGISAPADISQRVHEFFLLPGGDFDTLFNRVSATQPPLIDSQTSAPHAPTADDPALRRTMAALALAALAGDLADPAQRQDLGTRAVQSVLNAEASLTDLRATLGHRQEILARHGTGLAAESEALALARQSLLGVDPFEAASRLEATRNQIETLYTLTARLSRLSLTEYLR